MNRNSKRRAKAVSSARKKAGFKIVNPPSKRKSRWQGCRGANHKKHEASAWPKF